MIYQQHSAVVEKTECLVSAEAAAPASSSFFFSSHAAEMVLEMTVAVAAEVMDATASGSSWSSFAAVVDAATEMTAVVDVDANPEILTPDCHKLYQFYILNSNKASVRI